MESFSVYEMEYTHAEAPVPGISLRPFSDSFSAQYISIYNECFFEMRKALCIEPYDFYSDTDQSEAKKDSLFLLTEGGEIIGSVGCFGTEIDDLIVNRKYQGQGYGKKLLMWAVGHIRAYSGEPITLTVAEWNRKAVKLYLQNGFVIKNTLRIER